MRTYIPSRFPAFASRDFLYFWRAQLLSNIGSQMQFVALNWQVYLTTHSAFALGFIGFLRFVPILFFSLIGGSFADAHNRKSILFVTQTTLTLLSFILAVATFFHQASILLIYLITILSAIALSFDMPARQALIPSLVDKNHLANAMSLNSIMFQTAQILGPSISGLLIAKTSLGTIYILNAFSFLFVLASLYRMQTTGAVEGSWVTFSFEAIREGLVFVKSKTIIWSTMLLDFFSTFFSSATALLPIFAKDILAVGPTGLGLLYAAPSVGALLAGIFIAHKTNLHHQGTILLTAVTFYAIGTILFGISHLFLLSFISLLIVGAGDSISTIIRNTIRQLETPDYIRGRMTSVNMIFFMGGPQLGDFEAGVLAGYTSGPFSVTTGGIGTLVVIVLMAIGIPRLTHYDKHE